MRRLNVPTGVRVANIGYPLPKERIQHRPAISLVVICRLLHARQTRFVRRPSLHILAGVVADLDPADDLSGCIVDRFEEVYLMAGWEAGVIRQDCVVGVYRRLMGRKDDIVEGIAFEGDELGVSEVLEVGG